MRPTDLMCPGGGILGSGEMGLYSQRKRGGGWGRVVRVGYWEGGQLSGCNVNLKKKKRECVLGGGSAHL